MAWRNKTFLQLNQQNRLRNENVSWTILLFFAKKEGRLVSFGFLFYNNRQHLCYVNLSCVFADNVRRKIYIIFLGDAIGMVSVLRFHEKDEP